MCARSTQTLALPLGIVLLGASALAGPASAEGIVSCQDFKARWPAALAQSDVSKTAPAYRGPDRNGLETVSGLPKLQATLICREGSLGHFEIRATDPTQPLDRAAASALMALDREFTSANAAATVTGLKARLTGAGPASVSWGPYEISWGKASDGTRDEFILDMAEN